MRGQKMTAEREAEYVAVLRDPQYASERQRCLALGVTPSGGTQRKLQELRKKYDIPEPKSGRGRKPAAKPELKSQYGVPGFENIQKDDRLMYGKKRLIVLSVDDEGLRFRRMDGSEFRLSWRQFKDNASQYTKVPAGDPQGSPVRTYIDPSLRNGGIAVKPVEIRKPAADNPDFDAAVQDMVKGTKFEQVMARAKAEQVEPPKAVDRGDGYSDIVRTIPASIDLEMDPIHDEQMDPAYLFDRAPDMEREISETVLFRREYLDKIDQLLDAVMPCDGTTLDDVVRLAMGMLGRSIRKGGTGMTNYELIRNMSVEEMAVTIMCPNEMGMAEIGCDHSDDRNCCQCCLDWLNEEAGV